MRHALISAFSASIAHTHTNIGNLTKSWIIFSGSLPWFSTFTFLSAANHCSHEPYLRPALNRLGYGMQMCTWVQKTVFTSFNQTG